MQVAIAGAGIAGLTTAIALAERGFSVRVFERAAELKEVGAGIQLAPNATRILRELGVLPSLEAKGSEPDAIAIRSVESGKAHLRIPLGSTVRARYGAPYLTLHRADLQHTLLAAARQRPTISLLLGAEAGRVSQRDAAVTFHAAGRQHQADVLIGADGIHSAIRREVFKHPGPLSLRRRAWRCILPTDVVPVGVQKREVGLWLGSGYHLVHYAVSGGSHLNVVVIARDAVDDPRSLPLEGIARQLVDTGVAWRASTLFAADAVPPFVDRQVALTGDAAHAMSPSAAQGGAMAIEDAWVLATALSNFSPAKAALEKYDRIRRTRVARTARLSARNLNFYEAQLVPAFVRDALLKALATLPATLLLSQLDWLFAWKFDSSSRNANPA
jgi:salicylate hydroxylase